MGEYSRNLTLVGAVRARPTMHTRQQTAIFEISAIIVVILCVCRMITMIILNLDEVKGSFSALSTTIEMGRGTLDTDAPVRHWPGAGAYVRFIGLTKALRVPFHCRSRRRPSPPPPPPTQHSHTVARTWYRSGITRSVTGRHTGRSRRRRANEFFSLVLLLLSVLF